jgi:hypothetical protein
MLSFKMILFITMYFSIYGRLRNFITNYKNPNLQMKQKNKNIVSFIEKINISKCFKKNNNSSIKSSINFMNFISFKKTCKPCETYESCEPYEAIDMYNFDLFMPFLLI